MVVLEVIAVLTANLGSFDTPVDPVAQNRMYEFHRFTDEDFPPIAGLTPRMQYRIPKMFGWQMFPGYDYYVWLDGSVSFVRSDSLDWLEDKLGDNDMAFFDHPWRHTMQEETDHIEEYLAKGDKYLTPRYANGLHKEQLADCLSFPDFVDDRLYASTAFIYRDTEKVRNALREWWMHQSRYFTVDQIVLPFVLWKNDIKVSTLGNNPFDSKYIKMVSSHK
jgi:hypothetical protein